MANETYSFEIAAEVTRARKAVESFAKDTQKQLDGIKSSSASTSLATGFIAAATAAKAAFEIIKGVISTTIAESLEAEKANIQLANSMKLVGDFTQDAFNSFDDYATELAKVSVASDDQIKSSLALAKSFQLTNSEAKKVVQAATDLSAITGDSLNSSVEKLAKTFNGSLSKELKQLSPELKSLTEEQLRAGAAVDVIGNRFKGSALVINDSFGGALANLQKSLLNAGEAFGDIFTKSTRFIDLLRGSSSVVDAFAGAISRIGKGGEVFAPVEGSLEDIRRKMIEANKDSNLILDDIKKQQRLGQQSKTTDQFQKDAELRIKAQREANAISEKIQSDYESKKVELSKLGLTDIQKLEQDAAKTGLLIFQARNQGLIKSDKERDRELIGLQKETSAKIVELKKQEIEKIKAQNAPFASDVGSAVTGAIISGTEITKQQGIAAAAGFLGEISKGAAGAKDLVASIAGAVGDAIIPGIGSVVKQIVSFLGEGPEKVRETVRAFAKELPNVIANIAESIPVLVAELPKIIPKLITGIISKLPEIIKAFIAGIPEFFAAMISAFPTIVSAFIKELVLKAPEIVKGFAEEFLKIPEKFFKALLEQIPVLGKVFGGGGGGGGGGFLSDIPVIGDIAGGIGDIVGGIGDIFGVNKTDSRERFVPQDSQPLIVNLTVGQSQLARTILDLNRGGFRTS